MAFKQLLFWRLLNGPLDVIDTVIPLDKPEYSTEELARKLAEKSIKENIPPSLSRCASGNRVFFLNVVPSREETSF